MSSCIRTTQVVFPSTCPKETGTGEARAARTKKILHRNRDFPPLPKEMF